jgi:hypothetical protein
MHKLFDETLFIKPKNKIIFVSRKEDQELYLAVINKNVIIPTIIVYEKTPSMGPFRMLGNILSICDNFQPPVLPIHFKLITKTICTSLYLIVIIICNIVTGPSKTTNFNDWRTVSPSADHVN